MSDKKDYTTYCKNPECGKRLKGSKAAYCDVDCSRRHTDLICDENGKLTIEAVEPTKRIQEMIDRMAAIKEPKKFVMAVATDVNDVPRDEIKRRGDKAWKRN